MQKSSLNDKGKIPRINSILLNSQNLTFLTLKYSETICTLLTHFYLKQLKSIHKKSNKNPKSNNILLNRLLSLLIEYNKASNKKQTNSKNSL
jgi:hypothetical protein